MIFNRLIHISFLLLCLASLSALGQEIDLQQFEEEGQQLDSILNVIEDHNLDFGDNPASELYKNLWESTNIRYPSTAFSNKSDTIVITLVGPNDSPFFHPYKGKVISKYGPRSGRMHTGTDIKLHNGDSVYCAFDGKVRLARPFSGYGNMVLVRHNNGLETLYSHLKSIKVKVNDTIKAGDLIGLGGRSGRATTDHLHFETRLFGEPFDSNKYIDFETYAIRSQFLYYKNKKVSIELDGLKDTAAPSPTLASKGDSSDDSNKHVIRKGDNLWSIAKMYNTTVKSICIINNITTQQILKVGAILYLK